MIAAKHRMDDLPAPPSWLEDLLGRSPRPGDPDDSGFGADTIVAGELGLIALRLPGARGLSPEDLRRRTGELYTLVRERLALGGTPFPLRCWNFLPGIHDRMGDDLDRYMVFNAGRHDALCRWFEDPSHFSERMPTATGVGHGGEDLVVYVLGGRRPGRPAENPRQRPAYRYSRRYGPLPPCFARATLTRIAGRDTLLVGGTSSVRGEDSTCRGSLAGQLEETFGNLELLAGATGWDAPRFEDLRVYHVEPGQRAALEPIISARFPGARRLEFFRADICRAELLVEIEAVVTRSPAG